METLKTVHTAAFGAALLIGTGVFAQERGPGLLDNLFNRGEATQQRDAQGGAASELSVRLDRLENRLREMTGQIEQLQFRNQQLEQEIARLQGGAPVAAAAPRAPSIPPAQAVPTQSVPAQNMPAQAMPAPATSGRRSDAFDPSQNPTAPGVPRALGGTAAVIPAPAQQEVAIGAPGGRAPGAPLDLSSMSSVPMSVPAAQTASADPNAPLPAPPARNPNATGQQRAPL